MDRKDLFKPYEGDEKYIFVSYHHDDSEKVYEIITAFHNKGYRVWHDDGIPPGDNFLSILAKRLKKCEIFLAFLSPNYANSSYCWREMTYASANRKTIVPIMLEEFELPDELSFAVSALNWVSLSWFNSEKELVDELTEKSANLFKPCELEEKSATVRPGPEAEKIENISATIRPSVSEPVPADDGGEYVFISYAHKDKELVLPIISRLQQAGYAVWYDNGIDPGTEWDEFIANKVCQSGYFIAMISEAYLASSNCKDELQFARDMDKNRVLVYLESVKLPLGMQMRLGRLQAIHKYTYSNEEEFYGKLFCAKGLDVCRK